MKTKFGLIKIDQNEASIYSLGELDERKEIDIQLNNGNTTHYYKDVIDHCSSYSGIVLAAHGKGSANEALNFLNFLKIHNKSFYGKIERVIKTDNYETETQLLAKSDQMVGEKYFDNHNM